MSHTLCYKLQNLRTWSFSFKFSPLGHGKNLLTALLHHAFPSRHQLLFAYDYKLVLYIILLITYQLLKSYEKFGKNYNNL